VAEDLSFDLHAATWRHGHADEATYVEALATRLEQALPGLAQVAREHKLFAKSHRVVKIELDLDGDTFVLVEEHGKYVARKSKAVRGIVLSSKVITLGEWLQELSVSLEAYAREHTDSRHTLEEFLL